MIEKYDKNNNLIYLKLSSGPEIWREYDENNRQIHDKDSRGYESWWEYDINGNVVHFRNLKVEIWNKYDENNKQIQITEKEYKEIEFRKKEKEYLNRTKVSRFELMDI